MQNPCPYATLPDMLHAVARAFALATAIEEGTLRISYLELAARVDHTRRALQHRGISSGDRVALWAPNQWEWVVAALAVHAAGAILVPINTRYKGPEAKELLLRTQARLLFTVEGFLGLSFVSMLDMPELPTVVFRSSSWDAFQAEGEACTLAAPVVLPSDPCDILFTSGTTGRPKGVISTHVQTLQAYWAWSQAVGLTQADRYLIVAPFFHSFGYKAGWLACLLRGATLLPQAAFDADEILARISRDKISVLPGPPALYQSLLMRDVRGVDRSSLRLAVTGAASIPVQLVHDMRAVLGFQTVVTGYGLTESTGMATMCHFDDDPQTVAETSGRAIPGVTLKVVVDGRDALPGERGEILIQGYNVMAGYLEDPEATQEILRDGWLHTGDIGTLDARGYLRITDRLKDMVIVGGFNVSPAEVESMLAEHPSVGQAAVLGMPDPRLGEVCVAFVVPKAPLEEAALLAWCRSRMANFKVPRRVIEVEALPRNASGKVLKFVLREQLAQAGAL